MRRAIVLTGMAALVLAASSQAASLNKCIDAQGKVTYSNLPCSHSSETRTVEIDPAPRPQPAQRAARAQPAAPVVAEPAPPPRPDSGKEEPATLQLETRRVSGKPASSASAHQCDVLGDKLGRVFDKMDAARRKGYTQAQMNAWNEEAQDLERKKQQSGCF
jgi:hypothetical protein